MSWVRGYLLLVAAVLGGFAVFCLGWTEQAGTFIGYAFSTNDGRVDFIAVYGGLELGLALFVFAALRESRLVYAACLVSAFMFTGMVATRAAAISVHPDISQNMWGALVAEVLGAVLGWFAARASAPRATSP